MVKHLRSMLCLRLPTAFRQYLRICFLQNGFVAAILEPLPPQKNGREAKNYLTGRLVHLVLKGTFIGKITAVQDQR